MPKNAAANPVLVWLRNDLRIADNPALFHAHRSGAPVIPVYILDDSAPHAPGAASLWWLHHSLKALGADLAARGTKLILRRGPWSESLKGLVAETGAGAVFWNRRYTPAYCDIDQVIKNELNQSGIDVQSLNGNLLREPWELKTKSGGSYRVFSPFWRALQKAGPARDAPLAPMQSINSPDRSPQSDRLEDWGLTPTNPNWAEEISSCWTPGERGAFTRLHSFLDREINHYADGRDRPDREYTSRLSPHLAFGEISPLTIWHETQARIAAGDVATGAGEKFLSEIAWREFAYSLLCHHRDLPTAPLRPEFQRFEWREDASGFDAWRKGLTGFPIVDAGMRQLWRTGWMHNRVRMVVASFLVKDLLIPWQKGADWFWDTLVDADIANNAASWQWVAGCGADAAPYFRFFNPTTQGRKFDPDGAYVRDFVTELAGLPAKYIHAPWEAPENVLREAGVSLGKTYPKPILDHGEARRRALERYDRVKAG